MPTVTFMLNDKAVTQAVGRDDSLLTVLRKARRTGLVRTACAPPGSCSHCVVTIDNIPTLACLIKPVSVHGRRVVIGADQNQPFLVQYSGSQLGLRYGITKETLVVGRARSADLRLLDPSVSRTHAKLRATDQGIELENLNSSNGTLVNFNRVGRHRLRHGDIISCGTVLLKFRERLDLESAIQDMLYKLATTDQLTQVFNRRFMIDELDRFVAHFKVQRTAASVILFDLDKFKSVNDLYGHNAGDVVLRGTAAIIADSLRPQDILGRLGGEEFLVILPETSAEEAVGIAERCRQALEAHVFEIQTEKGVKSGAKKSVRHTQTLSLGVAELNDELLTRDELLNAADLCLYKAKDMGRNRVCHMPFAGKKKRKTVAPR